MLIIGSWCIISVWRGANTPIGGNRESVTSEKCVFVRVGRAGI